MTATELKQLIGSVRDILNQIEECVVEDDDNEYAHSECLDDLEDVKRIIDEALDND